MYPIYLWSNFERLSGVTFGVKKDESAKHNSLDSKNWPQGENWILCKFSQESSVYVHCKIMGNHRYMYNPWVFQVFPL